MFRKYRDGDFDTFLTECGVYELHREVFRSYYENGICEREEGVLLNEVEYEQGRMTEAIAAMLKALAKTHPIVLVINRFRMASRSAFELVYALIFKQVSQGKGFVSRFGGDEFIIILETKDKDTLEKIAKDIYARIDANAGFKKQIEEYLGHEITVDAGRLITCSIGIASAANVHNEDEINELIRKADDLLYTVKMGEKGHYKFL